MPLIIKPPNQSHRAVIEPAVLVESFKATVLEAVGLEVPGYLAPSLAGSWLSPEAFAAERPLLSSSWCAAPRAARSTGSARHRPSRGPLHLIGWGGTTPRGIGGAAPAC